MTYYVVSLSNNMTEGQVLIGPSYSKNILKSSVSKFLKVVFLMFLNELKKSVHNPTRNIHCTKNEVFH